MTTLVTALSFHQAGHTSQAAALYAQILATEPNNVDALYLLGILARQARRPGVAIQLMKRAINLKQDVAQFHNHLGEAFLDIGDTENGRKAFLRALQISPRYADAMLNLARLLDATGKHSEAATCYAAALQLAPNHEIARQRLKKPAQPAPRKRVTAPPALKQARK
jgi:Flp pilus assembly protein TadD